ncbi:MerR family transcriptional regulator [Halobacillus sp. A1]|uniref:MerR family transcriptional regulator n=1 Tax=Halobacillus sp. A1 TaxID=2880262 RepID=UPI0020A6285E|nr:MerR family transcriptional regulator [Halobacillus sp. A1]MCP3033078.1 MerR family transcriptional regulator [Halobacillus sp. A1]
MSYFTSGEVSQTLGLSVRTLRYYDQIGLVTPAKKEENGRRLYSSRELVVLEKILLLKSLSMSLEDIQKIINELTIEEILTLHKEKLENKIQDLQYSLQQTHSLSNILKLEGDLDWNQLLPLVRENNKRAGTNRWENYFNEDEQKILQEDLPKMEDPSAKKWINIIKRSQFCIQRGTRPDSEEAHTLAEDCLLLSEDFFKGDKQLQQRFWEARKSEETSKEMGLYPIPSDVLDFLEKAILCYEKN